MIVDLFDCRFVLLTLSKLSWHLEHYVQFFKKQLCLNVYRQTTNFGIWKGTANWTLSEIWCMSKNVTTRCNILCRQIFLEQHQCLGGGWQSESDSFKGKLDSGGIFYCYFSCYTPTQTVPQFKTLENCHTIFISYRKCYI